MAEKSEELAAMEAINKLKSTEAPQFLSPNDEISHCSRLSSRHIFRLLKPHTPKSPFEELLTEGFDAEQIWQQIDIQSQPLISSLKREIKRFERNPNQISSLFDCDEENEVSEREFKENDDEGLEISDEDDEEDDNSDNDDVNDELDDDDDEDEDEEDDDDVDDDDEDGVPEVEDDFLKINELEKFLRREEKKEYGGDDEVKTKTKTKKKKREIDSKNEGNEDDDESESDEDLGDAGINELLMYGGDDDEDEAQYNIRYEEFYLPNKKTPKSGRKQVKQSDDMDIEDEENVMPKRKQKQVTEVGESDESDEPESDDGDDTEDNKNLSTHEKERQKLQAKIKQMEEANLAAKDWTMQGEVTASKRPRDSALEVDLDFEHNVRPPPVITEEVTTSLEDMIKKRISEGHFDDVQKAPKLPSAAPKEKKELDDNKSKKGLAEIYEEEYAKQTGIGTVPLSHNDELRKEATGLFKRLCLKLDALSHFHFAPKPVVEDMTIQTNVPALAMEEIASVAVSDAAMLAPEEVFAGKGDIKEDTELTKEDRKKRRASKKRKFKAINAARTSNRPADKPLQDNVEAKEV